VILIVPENTHKVHVFQICGLACNVACVDSIALDLLLAHTSAVHVFGRGGHGVNDKVKDGGDGLADRVNDLGWVLEVLGIILA